MHGSLVSIVEVDVDVDVVGAGVVVVASDRVQCLKYETVDFNSDSVGMPCASIAALTIYDMCKAVDRGMEIHGITLMRKEGGDSGIWRREIEGSR